MTKRTFSMLLVTPVAGIVSVAACAAPDASEQQDPNVEVNTDTTQGMTSGSISSSGAPTLPCGAGKYCPPPPTPAPTTIPAPNWSCTCQNQKRVKKIDGTNNYECYFIDYYPCCVDPDSGKKCGPSSYISVYNPCSWPYPYRRCNSIGSCSCSAYP